MKHIESFEIFEKRNYNEYLNEEIELGKLGKLLLAGGLAAVMSLSSCSNEDGKKILAYDINGQKPVEIGNSIHKAKVLSVRPIRLRKFNYLTRLIVSLDNGKSYFITVDKGFVGRSFPSSPVDIGDRVKLVLTEENGYIEFDGEKYDIKPLCLCSKEHKNNK